MRSIHLAQSRRFHRFSYSTERNTLLYEIRRAVSISGYDRSFINEAQGGLARGSSNPGYTAFNITEHILREDVAGRAFGKQSSIDSPAGLISGTGVRVKSTANWSSCSFELTSIPAPGKVSFTSSRPLENHSTRCDQLPFEPRYAQRISRTKSPVVRENRICRC